MRELSILIPVRNYPLLPFVRALAEGIEKAGISGEIVIGDDGSDSVYSDSYHSLHHPLVRILRPSKNLGRARIRNLLGAEAKGRYLIFADADAGIPLPPELFLKRYLQAAKSHPVICGGTIYPNRPPEDPDLFLRWYYGRRREEKKAHFRLVNPHAGFSAFNFLIRRDIFLKHPFEENLGQYGHEDTLFGMELNLHEIPVYHLDNPLLHLGYEPARAFLKKSRIAVENLASMQKQLSEYPDACRQIRLLSTVKKCSKWRIDRLLAKAYRFRRHEWESRLSGKNPRIWLFDLYKLSYYCYLGKTTPAGDQECPEEVSVRSQ